MTTSQPMLDLRENVIDDGDLKMMEIPENDGDRKISEPTLETGAVVQESFKIELKNRKLK